MELKEPFQLNPFGDTPAGPTQMENGVYVELPNISGLDCLPESGEITFRFRRDEVKLRGEALSARICLKSITEIECDEDEEEKPYSAAIDKLFEEAKEKADQEPAETEYDE